MPKGGFEENPFVVQRVIPSERGIDHSECRYFVLDPLHDKAAFEALMFYANTENVRLFNPELCKDILEWLTDVMEQKIDAWDKEDEYVKGD